MKTSISAIFWLIEAGEVNEVPNTREMQFFYSEAKKAFEVIEASDDIMSVEVIWATEVFKST